MPALPMQRHRRAGSVRGSGRRLPIPVRRGRCHRQSAACALLRAACRGGRQIRSSGVAVMNRSILCVALAAALLQASALAAASHGLAADGNEAQIVDFDAMVVTAAAPSAALTFVTDPRQPRQPVPASDGADYLKTIPGFGVMRGGGTNGDPVLRGMFGSRLNLLAGDGALAGACPSRMDNAMSYISPENWDALTVTKGPQTVL